MAYHPRRDGKSCPAPMRPPQRLHQTHPSVSSPSFQRRFDNQNGNFFSYHSPQVRVTPTLPPVRERALVYAPLSSSSLGRGAVSGSSVFVPSPSACSRYCLQHCQQQQFQLEECTSKWVLFQLEAGVQQLRPLVQRNPEAQTGEQQTTGGPRTRGTWTAEETGLLRRGLLRYGPSKWAIILKDPKFEGLVRAGKNPCQLKDRCRSVVQRLIKNGVSRDGPAPCILGTPLGSGSDYRFDQQDLEDVLRFRDQAIGGFQGPQRGRSGSQWDNAMMDAVMGQPSNAGRRNPSPVVGRQQQRSQRHWPYQSEFQYVNPSHFGKGSSSSLKSSGEGTQRRYRNTEVVCSQLSADHSARRDSQGRQDTSASTSKFQWSARGSQQRSSQHRNMEIPEFYSSSQLSSSRVRQQFTDSEDETRDLTDEEYYTEEGDREETEESSAANVELLEKHSEMYDIFANLSSTPTSIQHSSSNQPPANSAATDGSEEIRRRVKLLDQLNCRHCTANEDLLQQSRRREQRLLGENEVLRNELQATRELLERIYEFKK
ncbi:hypothetical protein MIR68_006992 [Amoeboaphelidium protococcarum]|nr:hypothetical protein MIR68_006992 [Amoeboaphelidium protococcarum]